MIVDDDKDANMLRKKTSWIEIHFERFRWDGLKNHAMNGFANGFHSGESTDIGDAVKAPHNKTKRRNENIFAITTASRVQSLCCFQPKHLYRLTIASLTNNHD